MRAVAVVQALALVGIGLRGGCWPYPPNLCVCQNGADFDRPPPATLTNSQGGNFNCVDYPDGGAECFTRFAYVGPDGAVVLAPDGAVESVARGFYPPGVCSRAEFARGCQMGTYTPPGGPLVPPELPA